MRTRSAIISFRLPNDLVHLIDEHREGTGLSRGEWARVTLANQLTTGEQSLLEEDLRKFQGDLEELAGAVATLDKKLAYALFILLTRLGPFSAEDAKVIVRDELIRQGKG
jgi:hypothetical protein